MANPARLLWKNLATRSGTTVAASSAATGYPATNGQNTKRGLPWRSTTTTGNHDYTATFAATSIQAVGIVNPLAHTGGTVKAEYKNGGGAYANFGGGTGLFTIPSSLRTRLVILYAAAGVTATDVTFTFTNTGAVSSYVEIGVPLIVPAANFFEPSAKLSNERGIEPIDPSLRREALGGQRQAWKRQKTLTLSGLWPVLPRADLDTFMQMWDEVGATDPIVFAQAASSIDQTIYGTLMARPQYKHVGGDQWALRLSVEEAA